MTTVQIVILILIVHFLADFAMQTHDQATNKGEGKSFFNKWLFYHVGVYTSIWSAVYLVLPQNDVWNDISIYSQLFLFVILVGVPHYITDWITSRIGKPFWKNQDFHNGFVVVGFDQVIHYLCLLGVFHAFKFI